MKDFIQFFASESPVCSYFPSNDDFNSHMRALCLTAATGTAIGSNINAMTFIQKNAPIIFNILATIQSSPLPNVWKELFFSWGGYRNSHAIKSTIHCRKPQLLKKRTHWHIFQIGQYNALVAVITRTSQRKTKVHIAKRTKRKLRCCLVFSPFTANMVRAG